MNETDQNRFRTQITALLVQLAQENALGHSAQATVELDQQAVGRLSRMDALQNQAMAKASHVRRQTLKTRFEAALRRMDAGEFGYCEDCGDDIAQARLALDPAATRCISCAKG